MYNWTVLSKEVLLEAFSEREILYSTVLQYIEPYLQVRVPQTNQPKASPGS